MDQALSVHKCVRLAIMSKKSYDLLFKVFAAAPERTKDNLYQYLKRSSWDVLVGTLAILIDTSRIDQQQQITMQCVIVTKSAQ